MRVGIDAGGTFTAILIAIIVGVIGGRKDKTRANVESGFSITGIASTIGKMRNRMR